MAANRPMRGGEQRLGDARRDHRKASVFCMRRWPVKLCMMPQTVPNRPTNGAGRADGCQKHRRRSSRSTSRWMVTSITLSMRMLQAGERPSVRRFEAALPFAHRGDEQSGHAGVPALRQRGSSSSDWH